LLPAASWRSLMSNLSRHYGSDASLDVGVTAELSAWLQANAAGARQGRREASLPAEDRITRSTWFVREHREIGADVWRRGAVGSASNCAACHANAALGRFSEREVRVPR
jgi:mono/diheme cytochrome c family protein